MLALHIETVERRYRLSETQRELQTRLDLLTETLYREYLELACTAAGIGDDEALCVRDLRLDLAFDPDASDYACLTAWNEALTSTLRRVLADDNPLTVRRFRSRAQALIEFGAALANGRFDDFWAWSQLGLATFTAPPDRRAATEQWLAALGNEVSAVGVVRYLLRAPDSRRWLGSFSDEQLERLALVVLRETGHAGFTMPITASDADQARAERSATALRAGTGLAATLDERFTDVSQRQVVMVLAVVEAAPELLQTQTDYLGSVLALLAAPQAVDKAETARGADAGEPRPSRAATAAPGADVPTQALSAGGSDSSADTVVPSVEASAPMVEATPPEADEAAGTLQAHIAPGPSPMLDQQPAPASIAVREGIQPAPELWSEFAGLFLLLNPMREAAVVEQLVTSDELAGRTFGWIVEQFAFSLVDVAADDPALAAFTDRAPDSDPWTRFAPPISTSEARALAAARDTLEAVLVERLPDRAPGQLFAWLCRRPGHLELSPGWLTVTFSLEQVETDLRRAGLDLHPDFVPWLGCVVRFEYG